MNLNRRFATKSVTSLCLRHSRHLREGEMMCWVNMQKNPKQTTQTNKTNQYLHGNLLIILNCSYLIPAKKLHTN